MLRRLNFHRTLSTYKCVTRFSTISVPPSPPPPKIDDKFCDPENPKVLQFGDISLAHHKIQNGIERTTCRKSRHLSNLFEMEVYLKMEVNQDTGSFKERGARFALMNLSDDARKNGVYAASAGNHALALSIHGKRLGVKVNVVMPVIAPQMKINRCLALGANVLVEGADIAESREIALKMAASNNGTYINGYDHYDILAGAGTIGIEILEQVPQPDAVLVQVGGCGLIAGVATAIKTLSPNTQVIAIATETCQAFTNSLAAGKPIFTPTKPTLADGLAVPAIGVNAFASLVGKVDDVISVPENDIAVGILRLLENEKERAFLRNDMSSQRVKMVVEIRGKEHEEQIRKRLISTYSSENCTFKTSRLPGLNK